MYIRSLKIKNLKRLRDFKLDFTSEGGTPRMWSVLIGENGTGKSTILQAIALAAAGQRLVNGLAANFAHLADRRRSQEEMKIQATFSIPVEREDPTRDSKKRSRKRSPSEYLPSVELTSTVILRAGQTVLRGSSSLNAPPVDQEGEDPLDEARAAETPGWFVVGYGVNRTLPSVSKSSDLVRTSVNRMRPLFDPTYPLTSTDFISVFGDDKIARAYSRILQKVVIATAVLPDDISAFELRGQGGVTVASDLLESARFSQRMGEATVKVPAVALAHGYQSTIAWIADLVGHIVVEAQRVQKTTDVDAFQGLVLIDEIDLYLHPVWQAKLIPALRKTFPRLQFVATTHSPVVLATLLPEEVVRLQVDATSGNVQRVAPHDDSGVWGNVRSDADLNAQPDPRSMTGTEMYQEYFGVDRLTLNENGEDIRDYTALATNPSRNDYQDMQLHTLAVRLKAAKVGGLAEPVQRMTDSAKE